MVGMVAGRYSTFNLDTKLYNLHDYSIHVIFC